MLNLKKETFPKSNFEQKLFVNATILKTFALQ
jgi:hypothetical protein